MPELCPIGKRLPMDGSIPSVCLEQCEAIWDRAVSRETPVVDSYSHDRVAECRDYDVENGGESLQATSETGRVFSLLSICVQCEGDVYAEEYPFTCVAGLAPQVDIWDMVPES